VAVECHIYNQSQVIGILNGLIEGKVEGGVFEEESDVFIRDARVLGQVGTVARGAVDTSGIDLAIRCLFPQLPGDPEVRPKLHIRQCDRTFPQVDGVWWIPKLRGPELPWGLQAIRGECQRCWWYDRG
jgi:hypothetical protein